MKSSNSNSVNHRLHEENASLHAENYRLHEENASLHAENNRLYNENTIFVDRKSRVHKFVREALELIETTMPLMHKKVYEDYQGELGTLFTNFGSDKNTNHSYGKIYENLLKDTLDPQILEIGVGSLGDFPYAGLTPGGGLRAFKVMYPQSKLFGADIDLDALTKIEDVTIANFYVDQTSQSELERIKRELEKYGTFDLLIDDGFHEIHANLRTFLTLRSILKPTGKYVIEDVHSSYLPLWKAFAVIVKFDLEIVDLSHERLDSEDNILLIISNN